MKSLSASRVVPKHWAVKRLKYAATVIMGQSPPSEECGISADMGIPFLQGTAEFSTTGPIPRQYCPTPPKVAPAQSILFSVRAPVGELNNADQQFGIGRGLCAIVTFEILHKDYLWWALHKVRNDLKVVSTGSTYEAVAAEDVGNLVIPLPPLDEQKKIASYLNQETIRLDTLVTEKQNHLKLISEKRHALITSAVKRGIDSTARLKKSNIPWLCDIPEHWPLFRAKFLWRECSLPVRTDDEMVTCFRDGQVTLRKNRREDGFTNAVKELGYQGVRAGQLVLHSMDAFAGAIGVSDSEGKCTPEYIICDPVREDVYNPYYGYLLRIMAINGFVQATCTAVRERAPRIHFSDFGNMFFPVPPLEEQRAIVDHIVSETAKLDALRAATEKTIGLLKERRAALISAAVTGKIDTATSHHKGAKQC